jgi:hypothetical protein
MLSSGRRRIAHAGRTAFAALAIASALVSLFVAAAPTRAHDDDDDPAQLTVTVAAPDGVAGPRPTGRVVVSAHGGGEQLSLRLVRGEALTSLARVAPARLAKLGPSVTLTYSGDERYDASSGVTVTLPATDLPTIVAQLKDRTAPAIEILSPGDGARYVPGEAVLASYSCDDPDERSAVTECEGPVASGSVVDTASAGRYRFTVTTEDARGNDTSKTVTYEVAPPSPPPLSTSADSPVPPVAETPPAVAAPAIAAVQAASDPPAPRSPVPRPETPPPESTPASAPDAPAGAVHRARPLRVHSATSSPRPRARPNHPRTAGASLPAAASPVHQALAAYDPRSEPAKMIGILVAAFTLLQLGREWARARRRRRGLCGRGGRACAAGTRARGRV